MKSIITPLISLTFVFFMISLSAEPLSKKKSRQKRETIKVLKASHETFELAQIQIQFGKKFKGDLLMACTYQAYAYKLVKQKRFLEAQIYSFRARKMAFNVIEDNGGKVPKPHEFSHAELKALEQRFPNAGEPPVKIKETEGKEINDHYVAFKHPKKLKLVPKDS